MLVVEGRGGVTCSLSHRSFLGEPPKKEEKSYEIIRLGLSFLSFLLAQELLEPKLFLIVAATSTLPMPASLFFTSILPYFPCRKYGEKEGGRKKAMKECHFLSLSELWGGESSFTFRTHVSTFSWGRADGQSAPKV